MTLVLLRPLLKQTLLFLLFALVLGFLRQLLPFGIAFNGNWPTSSTSSQEAYEMIAQEEDPRFVSFQEIIQIQKSGEGVILDARSSKEYAEGRIPGSRLLPYYEIDDYQGQALEGVEAETPVVIYCEGLGCELSLFLARELKETGYTNLGIFYGGYPEWKNAGLPIEK